MRLPAALLALTSSLLSTITFAASTVSTTSTDLQIETIVPATCTRHTQSGDTIHVHYRGTLLSDGSQFDSSYDRDTPFTFVLGAGQVIKGWDQGLLDMCIGEGRKLTIPPKLGYGNSAVGPIPAGSTLVFETLLMGIEGVKEEADDLSGVLPVEGELEEGSEDGDGEEEGMIHDHPHRPPPKKPHGGPKDEDSNGECRLLGPFALLVQGALGALALLSLVFKRYRETPRRPLKIWWFDASKQVFGSVLLHLANLLMSMLSSGQFDIAAAKLDVPGLGSPKPTVKPGDDNQPNPCSFYLLNLAIDTTIGIPILILILRVLHHFFSLTPLANPPESIKSGHYGHPPKATWWLKQSMIYFMGLMGMKLCVFIIFALLPWLAWVGDWALRWTEGSEALQIVFVMLVFPLLMNGMQYYIIDSFIKDPGHAGPEEGHRPLAQEDSDDEDESEDGDRVRRASSVEDLTSGAERRKAREVGKNEVNPTAVPVGDGAEYDPEVDGDKNGRGSSRGGK